MYRRGLMVAAVVVGAVVLAGCDGGPAVQESSAPGGVSASGGRTGLGDGTGAEAAPGCAPDNDYGDVGNEVVGTPDTFRALLFASQVVAGQRIKIAFKIMGSGDLTLRADGPDGATVRPSDQTRHTGASSWQRPGDEWGSRWTFPTAGCWTIRAERTDGTRAALPLRAA